MGLFSSKPVGARCPQCGVTDEKNGIFCYACGAQIVFTSHGEQHRPRAGNYRWVARWASALFIAVGPLLIALYFVGPDLPFCPVVVSGFRVETETGRQGTLQRGPTGPLPHFPRDVRTIVVRGTYLLASPRQPMKLAVTRTGEAKPLFSTQFPARYLYGPLRIQWSPGAGRPLAPGTYEVELVYRKDVVRRLGFAVD
jgi:hypothetical protein